MLVKEVPRADADKSPRLGEKACVQPDVASMITLALGRQQ